MSDIGILNALKETNKGLRRIHRELTLLREAIQRMAPPPRELNIPDLETYGEMMEEAEEGKIMGFKERLKDLRKKAGLSQKELAAATGLSIATIQGYEQGKYEPKSDASGKLLAALGIEGRPWVLFDNVVLRADFGDGEDGHDGT